MCQSVLSVYSTGLYHKIRIYQAKKISKKMRIYSELHILISNSLNS
nr:MAG TPA: hypothetical protein [Caudoviricetes sp.]